jgi:DNA helicase-2/ATP-dependent DNA helicase PcrA
VTAPSPPYTPAQLARLLGVPEPTPEQAAVIGTPPGPLAVIAGAGSGKSETMAARLVWLVANGLVRPERVLGLTFTRKAAAELGERVRGRLDGLRRAGIELPAADASDDRLQGDPVIATYHAYAGRLVGDHALREAVEPSIRLITPAVAWQLAARVVAAYDGPMDAISWTPSTVTAAVLDLSGELAEHLRGPDDVRGVGEWLAARADEVLASGRGTQRGVTQRGVVQRSVTQRGAVLPAPVLKILGCQRVREQMLPLVAAYRSAKAAREVMDYGDQMALAARIAERHPEVGAAERGRYQVVLLDEYQDTSHAQLVLLRALFAGGHPVTAVGDPCQSIYGWRGASAGNLRRFGTDFPARDGTLAPTALLSTSFRNTGRVLDAAAAVQEGLRAAAPEVPRLVAPESRAGRGTVVCALLDSAAEEADWIAGQIAELIAIPPGVAPDGAAWPDGRRDRRVRPSDIAVLCRKRAQFPALRAAIEARGIPVEVVGLGGLLTVPEVQDVVATLRVMHDPTAADALARLLTSPRWRIGPRDLLALNRRSRALVRAAGRPRPAGEQPPADDRQPRPDAPQPPSATPQPPSATPQPASATPQPPSATPQPPADAQDVMQQAVSDLTADPGSLIEALDDLGDPAAYSVAGHARLTALAAELRGLREHAGRPLPELVGEVERELGLDIEVAARPGADPASSHADLDAFADAAAAFAGDQEEPTLGAFLAYLTAAEAEEFGLEGGRVGDTDSVKLATVHAAKGLQWAAVFVPGMSEGAQGHVFPARPKLTTRWTENPRLLPFGLRGDAADLPVLAGLGADSLASFTEACAERELAEERRLAYVATTRAAYWLGCSGYWWGGGVSRLGPSIFLVEVRAACEAGAGSVATWAEDPAEDDENPALAEPATATWPAAAAGARYEAVREAGLLVAEAIAAAHTPRPDPSDLTAQLNPDDQALVAAWERDADLLLAERAERRGDDAVTVGLPRRLPVSSLVIVARNPAELAQQVRRPMPRPPAPLARRGTEFHSWLEQRYGPQRLLDPVDLLGAADSDLERDEDQDIAELRERFEAGEWSGRWPAEVEVPFETLIGDRLVRGRIDAVFADAPGGGYDVVDWKTGRPPASPDEKRAVAVQLAAYRLAWAALAGVPVEEVRAAFYYVREDTTVRPADLLDEAGLAALIETIPAG